MTTPFDPKLKHLLSNYFSTTGDQHDTWQTFIQNDILTFDLLIDMWTLEISKKMKMKKSNNHMDAFTAGKLKLVNNVLLYYNFVYTDGEMVLAEYPTQWIRDDFRQWKTLGYPVNTTALNISQTGNKANTNTTLQASNTIAPISQMKLEDDAYMSWRLSKQDETLYLVLENDREYTN